MLANSLFHLIIVLFDNSIPLFVILDINLTMPSVELYTSLFKTAQIVFKLGDDAKINVTLPDMSDSEYWNLV